MHGWIDISLERQIDSRQRERQTEKYTDINRDR